MPQHSGLRVGSAGLQSSLQETGAVPGETEWIQAQLDVWLSPNQHCQITTPITTESSQNLQWFGEEGPGLLPSARSWRDHEDTGSQPTPQNMG